MMLKNILIVWTACACHSIYAQTEKKFDFGNGTVATGYIGVSASDNYSKQRGYGFRSNQPLVAINRKGNDALRDDFIRSDHPFYFEVDVPEGNYRITVVSGDKDGTTATTIKAESRRLMVENATTKKGKYITSTFLVNVRTPRISGSDSIRLKPRERSFLNWDNKLTLEFNGGSPTINAIEIERVENVPVVFLAGNSTVVDQEKEPWAAWGQMITRFFNDRIVVANFAESGEALKSFQSERRLEKISTLIKPGDFLFVEFAHNDQKPGSAHVDAMTTYKDEVRKFIALAKSKGATPVLVTSMNRRKFDDNGKIVNTLEEFPEAIMQLGLSDNVAVVDLNAMSKDLYEALGVEVSKKAFVHYPANTYPGQTEALEDNTHFNNYGAYQLAMCVVVGIKKGVPSLAKFLKEDFNDYNPSRPDDVMTWVLPASPTISNVKPDGN